MRLAERVGKLGLLLHGLFDVCVDQQARHCEAGIDGL